MPRTISSAWLRTTQLAVAAAISLLTARATAQAPRLPLTRAAAVDSAVRRGPRLAVARADTAAAFAQLLAARTFENPTLLAEYSKSAPQYHLMLDLPLDYPWLRSSRVHAAEAARAAASFRFAFERAAVALDADTTYTSALAALARTRLSAQDAQDADSLRRIAVARRDAGDASDLDVELATVNAGRQANVAAADSLLLTSALLDLQAVIGIGADRPLAEPTDSLTLPPAIGAPTGVVGTNAPTLPVAAARAALEAARLGVRLQRRSLFAATSITAGFETHDPGGGEPGVLPVVGLSLLLPLLNRHRAPIALARAEEARALAELELAVLERDVRVARVERQRAIALAKVGRDQLLLTSANRVSAMSLTAYREGASTLANVLEAQRNARELLRQYVDDLVNAWNATSTLRLFTLTATGRAP